METPLRQPLLSHKREISVFSFGDYGMDLIWALKGPDREYLNVNITRSLVGEWRAALKFGGTKQDLRLHTEHVGLVFSKGTSS